MSGPLATGLGVLALWLLVAIALSFLASCVWPVLHRLCVGGTPAGCVRVYLVFTTLAPVAAGLTALLVMHPEWSAALIPSHCHGTNCAVHQPAFAFIHPLGAALAAGSFLLVALLILAVQRAVRRTRRLLRMLAHIAETVPALDYALVPGGSAVAWCAGLWAPKVYLSSALKDVLSSEELRIVLAHEHAHARRRDNLRRLLVSCASIGWRRAPRRHLLDQFGHSTEQACDAAAAAYVGSTTAVARLIERLPLETMAPPGTQRMSFAAADRKHRLAALAASPATTTPLTAAWLVLALLWMSAPMLLVGPGHHLMEWVMSM